MFRGCVNLTTNCRTTILYCAQFLVFTSWSPGAPDIFPRHQNRGQSLFRVKVNKTRQTLWPTPQPDPPQLKLQIDGDGLAGKG